MTLSPGFLGALGGGGIRNGKWGRGQRKATSHQRRGRADEQFISQLFTVSPPTRLAKATYAHANKCGCMCDLCVCAVNT